MIPGKYTSYIILFSAVFFLSTSGIFAKLAEAPSGIIAFYRLLFAALVLWPWVIFHPTELQQLKNLTPKQKWLGLFSGSILATHYVLWFESLHFTSVASSVMLVTLQPLFAIIGCYFLFNERYSWSALSGCFIALIGCAIISWGDFAVSWRAFLGDMMAFSAAGVIAAYFLVGQDIRKSLSAITYSVLGYTSGAFFLGIYCLAINASFFGYATSTWFDFLGLALISTILGQVIFNWLLKWLSATVISMSILGEPIGTCILGYLFLGEVLTLQQGIGMLLILLGIGIFLTRPKTVTTTE